MFILDQKRISTMRSRLKEASDIIDDDRFLPMFRNRQKNYQEEFNQSVKLAKTKDNPQRYLARIWSKNNISKTLRWMRQMINRTKARLLEKREAIKLRRLEKDIQDNRNEIGLKRLRELYKHYGFLR